MREWVEVRCACGRRHTLGVGASAGDDRGPLVVLADGWGPLRPGTLQRWAREGRLRSFAVERGRVVAWERDVRAAVEMTPVAVEGRPLTPVDAGDEQMVALADAVGGAA